MRTEFQFRNVKKKLACNLSKEVVVRVFLCVCALFFTQLRWWFLDLNLHELIQKCNVFIRNMKVTYINLHADIFCKFIYKGEHTWPYIGRYCFLHTYKEYLPLTNDQFFVTYKPTHALSQVPLHTPWREISMLQWMSAIFANGFCVRAPLLALVFTCNWIDGIRPMCQLVYDWWHGILRCVRPAAKKSTDR